jgi:hypothetical protein
MSRSLICWSTVVAVLVGSFASVLSQEPAPLSIWADPQYDAWDNPLQTEVLVNGTTVDIFTGETVESVAEQIKQGWNSIVLKTTPQVPATRNNGLTFRVGPARKQGNQIVVSPVLWQFDNKTDWQLEKDGTYSHPLGPGVTDVELTFKVYYTGMEREGGELKAGDYVLVGKPTYNVWNSPVVATVWINGTALNSFTTAERQLIVTDLLKPGKNEIKILSSRVPNAIKNNDVEFWIGGPAEWSVADRRFTVKPIVQFKAMQGWRQNRQTGQLENPSKAGADEIERIIPFMVKTIEAERN